MRKNKMMRFLQLLGNVGGIIYESVTASHICMSLGQGCRISSDIAKDFERTVFANVVFSGCEPQLEGHDDSKTIKGFKHSCVFCIPQACLVAIQFVVGHGAMAFEISRSLPHLV